MITLLTAFALWHFNAHWAWWVLFVCVAGTNGDKPFLNVRINK